MSKTKTKADHSCIGSEVQEVSSSGTPVFLEKASAILSQKKSGNKIRIIGLQKRLTGRGFSLPPLLHGNLSITFSSMTDPGKISMLERLSTTIFSF